LAWVWQKANALINNGEKELSKVTIQGQKEGYIFEEKKCCRKCAKSHAKRKLKRGMLFKVK
jgi:hypothetical protein